MSDKGHERHFERAPAVSALPPIATKSLHCDKWRSGPIPDSCTAARLGLFRNSLSDVQLVEKRLGFLQIERVEAFGEPAVDRGEEIAGRIPLAPIAPEPRHARRVGLSDQCIFAQT